MHKQAAQQGDEDAAVFTPGVVGDARLPLPQPFAAQLFFECQVFLGVAPTGRGDEWGVWPVSGSRAYNCRVRLPLH
ncbi:MAG: hypothetical protein M5U34_26760 [Chloroflexi bacterium]|nr:hypothetical protein [Chloroflexota bacterium]